MEKPKIIFFGTPDFALRSLELINSHCDILCVVTSQDKKSGRGLRIHQSEVKKFSIINNIMIKQPEDLRNIDFINQIKSMNADLFIVVAFRKIPKEVYSVPKLGTINLHASLLPDYRGAAPINWALINNEKVTGVTTFFINEKIDHGDIISKKEVLIDNDDDYKSLYRKLSIIGSNLLLETIMMVFEGKFQIISQSKVNNKKKAPKLNSENTRINWEDNTERILGMIRGLSPSPGSWTILKNGDDEVRMKIIKANFYRNNLLDKKNLGKLSIVGNNIYINTKGGQINCTIVQIENKKEMSAKDLLNGYQIHENSYVY
ncbi:methionyl-tRNA formyltransferase [Flavobacteriaceae bacterium]|nr:methionyl-tRNA formyltransferase [Flavobacteriaceae bacterium]